MFLNTHGDFYLFPPSYNTSCLVEVSTKHAQAKANSFICYIIVSLTLSTNEWNV